MPQNNKLLFVAYDGGARYPGTRLGPGLFSQWQQTYNPNLFLNFQIESIPIYSQGSSYALNLIHKSVDRELRNYSKLLMMGGDHSITVPGVESFQSYHNSKINLIIFDAHHDYDKNEKNIKNWNILNYFISLDANILFLGVRDPIELNNKVKFLSPLRDQLTFNQTIDILQEKLDNNLPTYLSIDLDVLNIHEFPGVTNGEPGGYSFIELYKYIQFIFDNYQVSMVDIVEFNPTIEKDISLKVLNLLLEGVINFGFSRKN